MFVDHIKISATAGNGGCGCVSFRREKFIPNGGPDGGDGGRGGSIILRTDNNVDNLSSFFYEPIVKAKNGAKGAGRQCSGRGAKDKIVLVPIGTLVYRMPPKEEVPFDPESFVPREKEEVATEDLELVADLAHEGDELVLCKGGIGGRGNIHFKSSRNRVPTQYTEGTEGESGIFYLELQKIADAGLVGYPNAGKSTLLGKISAAHPKVAPYPFTTLHPIVGVVEYTNYRRLTVADIPGLIDGAHLNVGLGHEFLRHIVRCKMLLHMVDIAGSEGRSPIDDITSIRKELKLYDPLLAERPWMVVANKMDLPEASENLKVFKRRFPKIKVIPISAEKEEGLDVLKKWLADKILTAPESAPE